MSAQPELESLSLTVVGSFDPSLFHPAWFRCNGLLRDPETDAIRVGIVHPEVTNLSAERFDLHAVRDRLTLRSATAAAFEGLCTLACDMFKCPGVGTASVIQLRRAVHLASGLDEAWEKLAEGLLAQATCHEFLSNPRLRCLEMEESRWEPPGVIRLRVEPSSRIDGICVSVTHLYAVREDIAGHVLQILGGHCMGDLSSSAQLLERAVRKIRGDLRGEGSA